MTTRYVRGDAVDQLFARVSSSDVNRWYLVDHQGSIRNILDNAGASKDALAYDAFGNIVSETNSAERGRYAWTSREIDTETGLQYNRARYYDATTGRWISQDPMGFDAGDSNLYRYVENNPVNRSDASGYFTDPPIFFDVPDMLPSGKQPIAKRPAKAPLLRPPLELRNPFLNDPLRGIPIPARDVLIPNPGIGITD